MNKEIIKQEKKQRRANRTRANIFGTAQRPRLNVFKSNTSMFAQLIDDENSKTLVGVHSKTLKSKENKTEVATQLGKLIAKQALEKNIKKVIFDRGSFPYHGRVKALADGAREGGLEF
jgi:large subunit ribosomal protein L18